MMQMILCLSGAKVTKMFVSQKPRNNEGSKVKLSDNQCPWKVPVSTR